MQGESDEETFCDSYRCFCLHNSELDCLIKDSKLKKSEVLTGIMLEDLPPCYSFIMIKPYTRDPIPELKYWSCDANGAWKITDGCDGKQDPQSVIKLSSCCL
jgi:hypothetical protein